MIELAPSYASTLPRLASILLVTAPLLTGGCWLDCEDESVVATFSGTMRRGSNERRVTFEGAHSMYQSNYSEVKAILVGDDYDQSKTVIFTLTTYDSPAPDWFGFDLAGPYVPGDILPIEASGWGGWGVGNHRQSKSAGVYAEDYDYDTEDYVFRSTSASGALEVVEVKPLSFRVDMEVTNDEQETIELLGDLSFTHEVEDVACD